MKILITTDWYSPVVNGVVTSILNLRQELLKQGHDVRVLTLSQSAHSFERGGITYIGSVGAGKIYPGARVKTAFASSYVQKILCWRPDIIHSQCEFSTFFLARKIAKKLNIPIVHTYHTVYEDYTHYFSPNQKWGRSLVAKFSRWVIKQTACVIAPTEKVKNILNGYNISREIYVVPTGIELDTFSKVPSPETVDSMKRDLGIPAENMVLIYLGRIAKEKNVEELLSYQAELQGEKITLLIVGDGPYRGELERQVARLKIQNSVVFAGMVAPERVAEYYHLGDVFVSASGSETQGLTYIEALASGLPALCHADECLDGVIINGQNGWQYNNREEFFSFLNAIKSDKSLREDMAACAEQMAQQNFSSATFAQRVEAVYQTELNLGGFSVMLPLKVTA